MLVTTDLVTTFLNSEGKKHDWKYSDVDPTLSSEDIRNACELLTTLDIFEKNGVKQFDSVVTARFETTIERPIFDGDEFYTIEPSYTERIAANNLITIEEQNAECSNAACDVSKKQRIIAANESTRLSKEISMAPVSFELSEQLFPQWKAGGACHQKLVMEKADDSTSNEQRRSMKQTSKKHASSKEKVARPTPVKKTDFTANKENVALLASPELSESALPIRSPHTARKRLFARLRSDKDRTKGKSDESTINQAYKATSDKSKAALQNKGLLLGWFWHRKRKAENELSETESDKKPRV